MRRAGASVTAGMREGAAGAPGCARGRPVRENVLSRFVSPCLGLSRIISAKPGKNTRCRVSLLRPRAGAGVRGARERAGEGESVSFPQSMRLRSKTHLPLAPSPLKGGGGTIAERAGLLPVRTGRPEGVGATATLSPPLLPAGEERAGERRGVLADCAHHGAVEGAGAGASIAACKAKPPRPRQPRRSGVRPSTGCRPRRSTNGAPTHPLHPTRSRPSSQKSAPGAKPAPCQMPNSPCPPSALLGRRGNGAPIPPAFRLRHSGGREQGEPGPGWEAARRSRGAKARTRGQATAVTVPRAPRGGVRLSRGARWDVPVRAAQMPCNLVISRSNGSFSIALRIGRQGEIPRVSTTTGQKPRETRVPSRGLPSGPGEWRMGKIPDRSTQSGSVPGGGQIM